MQPPDEPHTFPLGPLHHRLQSSRLFTPIPICLPPPDGSSTTQKASLLKRLFSYFAAHASSPAARQYSRALFSSPPHPLAPTSPPHRTLSTIQALAPMLHGSRTQARNPRLGSCCRRGLRADCWAQDCCFIRFRGSLRRVFRGCSRYDGRLVARLKSVSIVRDTRCGSLNLT